MCEIRCPALEIRDKVSLAENIKPELTFFYLCTNRSDSNLK